MGIIRNGILGPVSGKVGGVVGGTWKGIPYLRAYKIPSNPQTDGQVAQRNLFSASVLFCQACYTIIILNYWNPFAVKMSGFNNFMKQNINSLGADPFPITTSNTVSQGSLEGATPASAVLAGGVVTVTWDEATISNGALTDGVDLIVIDKNDYKVYGNLDTLTRTAETGDVTCTGETTASDLIAFLVCKKGTGSSFVVSDSQALQVTS